MGLGVGGSGDGAQHVFSLQEQQEQLGMEEGEAPVGPGGR